MNFFKDKDEHDMKIVKIVLITAGVVLAVAAATVVIYKVAKKRFKINFDCEDCDFDDDFSNDDDDDFIPEFVAEGKQKVEEAAEKVEDAVDDIFDEIEKEAE